MMESYFSRTSDDYFVRSASDDQRQNDEMSAHIGLYTVDEFNLSELEGCRRNVPSKRGVHLKSIKWISCVFATLSITTDLSSLDSFVL